MDVHVRKHVALSDCKIESVGQRKFDSRRRCLERVDGSWAFKREVNALCVRVGQDHFRAFDCVACIAGIHCCEGLPEHRGRVSGQVAGSP